MKFKLFNLKFKKILQNNFSVSYYWLDYNWIQNVKAV